MALLHLSYILLRGIRICLRLMRLCGRGRDGGGVCILTIVSLQLHESVLDGVVMSRWLRKDFIEELALPARSRNRLVAISHTNESLLTTCV